MAANTADLTHETAIKLERESAEITEMELVSTRTTALSKQAGRVLVDFNSRLVDLEQAIMPIRGSTQKMAKTFENIEQAILVFEKVMVHLDAHEEQKAALTNPPKVPADLDQYFEAMDKVRSAYAFITTTAKLVQSESLKLAQRNLLATASLNLEKLLRSWFVACSRPSLEKCELFLRLAAIPLPPDELGEGNKPDVSNLPVEMVTAEHLENLKKLSSYLASFETDADIHGTGAPPTNYCKVMTEVRAKYVVDMTELFIKSNDKSISMPGSEANVGSPTSVTSSIAGKQANFFLTYLQLLLYLLEMESEFLSLIIPANNSGGVSVSMSRASRQNTYKSSLEAIALPAMSTYSTNAETLLHRVRRSVVQNHDFSQIFDLVSVLDFVYLGPALVPSCLRTIAGKKLSAVRTSFNEFTATVLKAFSDFTEDIKHSGSKYSHLPEDGTVHELSSNAMGFIKRLSEYPNANELILRVLYQLPNWEQFAHTSQPQSPGSDVEDLYSKMALAAALFQESRAKGENGMSSLRKYAVETLELLESNLVQKAKSFKKGIITTEKTTKSIVCAIFLLNNYYYVLKSLRSAPELLKVLGPDVEAKFSTLMQAEMVNYLESWNPTLQILMDTGAKPGVHTLSKTERNAVKELFNNFNSELEDNLKIQKKFVIPDPELRLNVVKQIKKVVMPLYTRVFERYHQVEFTKNAEKYFLYDIAGLNSTIDKFF
eukprot:Partr_v1_DN27740_c0_g1_i1_m67821 putative exocyst complex